MRLKQKGSLIAIVGPTAVGKSGLALRLCRQFAGEIVSADSRQIYRRMDIGTAKPSAEERSEVPHHVIDVVDPDEEYTLARYQADAFAAIDDVLGRGKQPMLVGGSGLYVRAVVQGLRIPRVPPDASVRARLQERAQLEGAEVLHRELQYLDPESAGRIDHRNVRRVIRALEVCLVTGRPMSSLQRMSPPPYSILLVGLTTDRARLYGRIDQRVEAMIAAGLIDETRSLVAMGYDYSLPAMTGLGYRQIGMYLRGEVELSEAIGRIKYETHRFARQQYTWFRPSDPRIVWLQSEPDPFARAVELVEAFLGRSRSPV